MNEIDVPLFHFSRGQFIEADYQDPLLEDYRNNPLLEALPPIWDDKTVVKISHTIRVLKYLNENYPSI